MCPRKKRILLILTALILSVVFVVVMPLIPWRTEYGWCCSTCGARKRQTRHLLWGTYAPATIKGIPVSDNGNGEAVLPSPLTDWMKQKNILHTHNWKSVMGTTYDPLGLPHLRSHGMAPASYNIAQYSFLMKHFVKTASDDEIRELVTTLNGPKAQAEVAVNNVLLRMLESMTAVNKAEE